jgi:MFS family permease
VSRYRILAILTIAQVGASLVQQGFGVLAPFIIADFALSKAAFGVLFSAMVLGTAAFTAVAGALADRIGERRTIGLSAALMALALLTAAAVENYFWLLGGMLLFGITYAAQPSAGTRAVMAWFTQDRALAMSFRQTGVPLGGMLGALVLPATALAFGGYRAALVVGAIAVALSAALVLLWYREPADAPARTAGTAAGFWRGIASVMRDRRMIGLAVSAIGLTGLQQSTASFLVLTEASAFGLSTSAAATAFACAQGAAVAGRLFWSWFSDRVLGGERILLVAMLSCAAGLGAVMIGSLHGVPFAIGVAVAILMGLTASGWNGVFLTVTAEIGGAERAGTVVGALSTVIFGASAVTPAAFGLIAQHASLAAAWYAFAALGIAGALPLVLLRR